MSDTHTPEQYNQTPTASPGEQLQRQREQLNISVEEAAEALHLRPAVINGLEHDNYDGSRYLPIVVVTCAPTPDI
ncbi:helix-turn-helix domain-containing protein [Vreelandella azerica]|uniref:helix-turn-helix domain-containing protein n=1 Tax=Vreelandella azerica TaxID=2732867 RepID=UPI002E2DD220|nr:helix-turn-helix domain-containing protein [Halomonas azerica]